MNAAMQARIRIVRFDVGCRVCAWTGTFTSMDAAVDHLEAHRQPVLLAMHSSIDGQPPERWVCRKPRLLRR